MYMRNLIFLSLFPPLLTALIYFIGKVGKQEVSVGVVKSDLGCNLLVPIIEHHHLHCYCLTPHHASCWEVHGHKEGAEHTQLGGMRGNKGIKVLTEGKKKQSVICDLQ